MPLVLANGMPRAASTLQFNMARLVIERDESRTLGPVFVTRKPWRRTRRLFRASVDRPEVTVIKTHWFCLDRLPIGAMDDGRVLVLHSYRDLRDAVVSAVRLWGGTPTDYLGMLARMTHVDRMLEGYPNVFRQRYETMVDDVPAAVAEVAAFLSVPLDADEIDAIVEELDRLKSEVPRSERPPRRWGYRIRQLLGAWRTDRQSYMQPGHVSRSGGEPGAWREALTPEEAAVIEDRFGGWLRWRGYA